MFWREVSKMSNPITTIAQLESVFAKVFHDPAKDNARCSIYSVKFFDKSGNELRKLRVMIPEVEIRGIVMPFLEMKTFDVGAQRPLVQPVLRNDTVGLRLAEAFVAMIEDAVLAYVYGLDSKFIKHIERVAFIGSNGQVVEDTFCPRIQYVDGTTLDVKRGDLKEIPGNPLKFFTLNKGSNDVFFNDENYPKLFRHSNKNGDMFPKVDLDAPGSFSMPKGESKRAKDAQPTANQMNIHKWGVQVYEATKNAKGEWVRGNEDIIDKIPLVTEPKKYKSFLGCISMGPSYITIMGGDKSTLHMDGSVMYISPMDSTENEEQISVATSLPTTTKKMAPSSKALAAAAAASVASGATIVKYEADDS
jgi:hypothetical protein